MPQNVNALYRRFETLAALQQWRQTYFRNPELATTVTSEEPKSASQINSSIKTEKAYSNRRLCALADITAGTQESLVDISANMEEQQQREQEYLLVRDLNNFAQFTAAHTQDNQAAWSRVKELMNEQKLSRRAKKKKQINDEEAYRHVRSRIVSMGKATSSNGDIPNKQVPQTITTAPFMTLASAAFQQDIAKPYATVQQQIQQIQFVEETQQQATEPTLSETDDEWTKLQDHFKKRRRSIDDYCGAMRAKIQALTAHCKQLEQLL